MGVGPDTTDRTVRLRGLAARTRECDDDGFAATGVSRTDNAKLVHACFEPEQFIPVHAPDSDVIVTVRRGLRNDEFEPELEGSAAEVDPDDRSEVRR